jgi:sulfoxide reductase heme-binding subunit YedZ
MTRDQVLGRIVKPAVFLACLAPAVLLTVRFLTGNLGFDPIADLTDVTGHWGLRMLLASLAITPLRRLTGRSEWTRFRRMLGLFAFFYAVLHLSVFVVFDFFFDFRAILADIPQRPFITMGFTAFVCLVPLAITSTKGWIRRLGGKRWQRLHRLAYVAGVAATIHYFWVDKVTEPGPVFYMAVVTALLGFRLIVFLRRRTTSRTAAVTS